MPEIDGNPAALRIEQIPMMGPPQVELDNGDEIDALLEAWNEGRLSGPTAGCSIARGGLEGMLAMFGLFGLAWFSRARRR